MVVMMRQLVHYSESRTAPRTTTGPAGMTLPDDARRWLIATARVRLHTKSVSLGAERPYHSPNTRGEMQAAAGARLTGRHSGCPQRNIVPLAHSSCCPGLATVLLQHVTRQRKGTPQSAAGEEARHRLALCIAHQPSKCE